MLVIGEPAPTTTSCCSVFARCTATTLNRALPDAAAKIGGISLDSVRSSAPACSACSCLSPPGKTAHWTRYGVWSRPATWSAAWAVAQPVAPTRRVTEDRSLVEGARVWPLHAVAVAISAAITQSARANRGTAELNMGTFPALRLAGGFRRRCGGRVLDGPGAARIGPGRWRR